MSLLILAFLVSGCTGWKMDYGKPAAHIQAEDLRTKGKPYIGGKVAIRGKVESVDTTNSQSCWVILEGNIRCHYGDFQAAANEVKVGETITVSGVLTVVEDGKVVLDPALGRDIWHAARQVPARARCTKACVADVRGHLCIDARRHGRRPGDCGRAQVYVGRRSV